MTFNDDCPFCKRIEDDDYFNWYSNDSTVYFEPLNPVTPGHMLFVPVQHFEHDDVGAAEAVGKAFEMAHKYVRSGSMEANAFNLITSYGSVSTQTVPHIHIHLVPRREGDGLQLPWGLPHGS